MAKIIVQTNSGKEVQQTIIYRNNLRHSNHSVISFAAFISEVLKALDEAFDIDEKEDNKPDGKLRNG